MEELEKKILDLESRLTILEDENSSLKNDHLEQLKSRYDSIVYDIALAVEYGDKLEEAHQNFENEVSSHSGLILLTMVNNPTADILGFKFADVIGDKVRYHFTEKINDEAVKTKFGDIVSKIVENPVVAALLTTNPVTGVVYRIVDKINDFSENHPFGVKGKAWMDETREIFTNDRISKFMESLQPYMALYDDLLKAAVSYRISIDRLTQRKESLGKALNTYYTDLLNELGIERKKDQSNLLKVQRVLGVDGNEYGKIVFDEKINKALGKAKEYRNLDERFKNLRDDYYSILSDFFDQSLRALDGLEAIKSGFDSKKVDEVKKELQKVKKSLSKNS